MPASQEPPPHRCPRCRGTIILETDQYGFYGYCIVCGYCHEVLTSPPIDLVAEEAARPSRRRYGQPSHAKMRL